MLVRRRGAGGRDRRPRGARARRRPDVLGARRSRRSLRRRHGLLHPGLRRDRARTSCPAADLAAANSLDQFVRPIALRLRGPGAWRRARRRLGTGRSVRGRRRVLRRLDRCRLPDAAAGARRARHHIESVVRRRQGGACASCGGASGSGARSSPPRSPTSPSSAPPRCCCPTSSRTTCTPRPATSGSSSPPEGSERSASALVMGQRGHPRRDVTFMYATWTLATLAVAGYGLATAPWQLMVACLALQRARDGGHDRLGDDQAAPRSGVDARPRLEPRLADLDRPAAALVRAHGAGGEPRRRARDAGRRRRDRRRDHARRALPPRDAGPGRHPGRARRRSRRRDAARQAARLRRRSE